MSRARASFGPAAMQRLPSRSCNSRLGLPWRSTEFSCSSSTGPMSLVHQLFLQTLLNIGNVGQREYDAYRMPLVGGLLEHLSRNVAAYGPRLAAHRDGLRFDLDR